MVIGGYMNGILIIDKPKGITSRDVVNKVIKIFNTKKVGHTGTLDPLATGVLVVCVGRATKLVDELTSTEKEYIASVTLGIKTDTLDSMGSILFSEDVMKTKKAEWERSKVSKVASGPIMNVSEFISDVTSDGTLYDKSRVRPTVVNTARPKRKITVSAEVQQSRKNVDDLIADIKSRAAQTESANNQQ